MISLTSNLQKVEQRMTIHRSGRRPTPGTLCTGTTDVIVEVDVNLRKLTLKHELATSSCRFGHRALGLQEPPLPASPVWTRFELLPGRPPTMRPPWPFSTCMGLRHPRRPRERSSAVTATEGKINLGPIFKRMLVSSPAGTTTDASRPPGKTGGGAIQQGTSELVPLIRLPPPAQPRPHIQPDPRRPPPSRHLGRSQFA